MFYKNTDHLDKLMNEAFRGWPLWETTVTTNSTEYHSEKTDIEYLLELPVPGLSKEDLSVKIVSGKLEVKGGKEDHKWTPKFEKTFLLPKDINTKKVEATVENGVLIVKIGINKESETIVKII
jgi:HSP20 family molecular chaperone IbpA